MLLLPLYIIKMMIRIWSNPFEIKNCLEILTIKTKNIIKMILICALSL